MKTLITLAFIFCQTFVFAQNNSIQPNSISFTTEVEDGITILKWDLNREVNTSYFLIERSDDGEHYETLSTQKASSSTYKTTGYEFEDNEGSAVDTKYRITMVMMDGTTVSALSEPVICTDLTSIIAE